MPWPRDQPVREVRSSRCSMLGRGSQLPSYYQGSFVKLCIQQNWEPTNHLLALKSVQAGEGSGLTFAPGLTLVTATPDTTATHPWSLSFASDGSQLTFPDTILSQLWEPWRKKKKCYKYQNGHVCQHSALCSTIWISCFKTTFYQLI